MARFESFVVFAEMRTGSNYLESNLNAIDGIVCHGEAFNPHFIGYPDRTEVLGISRKVRDSDPQRLLTAIQNQPGVIGGFRFFHDHDPRILPTVLGDPACAKIILTRNPAESYVSRKIAAATGQWKLTHVRNVKSQTVRFSAPEFEAQLHDTQDFQLRLLGALQRSGQTAFYLDYDDLQDLDVLNGIAAYLGVAGRLEGLDRTLKKQNPEPLSAKVANYSEMQASLARLDRFNLTRTPNFEPRRGPAAPTYVAAPASPLMYLPVRSGPEEAVRDWLAALDGGGALKEGFNQNAVRQWKSESPGHRSFTVLRHPVARAHSAFCDRIAGRGPGTYTEIRQSLIRGSGLQLPDDPAAEALDDDGHRAAFLVFLAFLKANLGGQTAIRVDATWATQIAVLQGIAGFAPPDAVLREERLQEGLTYLAGMIDRTDAPAVPDVTDSHRPRLAAIYDATIEKAARDAYQRDYLTFGFEDWVA